MTPYSYDYKGWTCTKSVQGFEIGEAVTLDTVGNSGVGIIDRDNKHFELTKDEFFNCFKQRKTEVGTKDKIEQVCDQIKAVLLEKNKRYGDAALHPANIFSKQDAQSSILIRIDDKISRIKNSEEIRKNDVFDLIGYLTLFSAAKGWDFEDLID